MPALVTFLVGGLVNAVGAIVAKVLLALGIGFATYSGLGAFVDAFKTQFTTALSGLPPAAFQMMGVLQVGTCVNILASALVARMLVSGAMAGSITKTRYTQG